ncbi:MAG: 3-phosphoserine/phosphohydroxythreonine transaminase [Pseudomonadota bacterium]
MSSQDTFYFGAGPATLPHEVLVTIQRELIDFQGTGLSVLELSHRSELFADVLNQAESLLRELMQIPDDFAVLFLHGGATAQYSMLPLNFLRKNDKADYLCSGHWSTKACREAKHFANINEVNVLEHNEKISICPVEQWKLHNDSVYLHYCDNETISGVAFKDSLTVEGKKIFCDMTSSILTKPIQVQEYDFIYASAQKNLGIAGLCITIVKKAILEETNSYVPSVFDYKLSYKNNSLVNTPPTFAIYVLGLMMQWLKSQGGVSKFSAYREERAGSIYQLIDRSDLFKNIIADKYRSPVNIPFEFIDNEIQEKFLQQAKKQNLLGLRGHKSVGGARISFYNAMPLQGTERLIEFMHDFELSHT